MAKNKNLTIVHSLPTKNKTKKELWCDVCYTTLSCIYAKLNNFNTLLFTDNYGKTLLQYAPYDETTNTLQEQNQIHHKIITLSEIPKDYVYNDCGVIIKKEETQKYLKCNKFDCVIQSSKNNDDDKLNNLFINNIKKILTDIKTDTWFDVNINDILCTNTIVIKNKTLKNDFINEYWKLISLLNNNTMSYVSTSIIEERLFSNLIKRDDYNVKKIIKETNDINKIHQIANKIGYQNITPNKQQENLKNCLLLINKLDNNMIKSLLNIKKEFLKD